MICHRCLLRQSRQVLTPRSSLVKEATRSHTPLPPRPHPRRHATTTAKPLSPNIATQTTPRQGDGTSHNPPAATSTSAAQPFSAPLTPSPKGEGAITGKALGAGKDAKPKPSVTVKSSCPAGTPLKGLNFIKGQQDPLALEDSAYPPWLWTVLDKKKSDDVEEDREGLFSKSAKQRRLAAKRLRKQEAMNPGMREPKIPIYEQSIDLPAGDGSADGAVQAGEARDELTREMRKKRRGDIKTANFLKSMG